jgi:predicted permease
MGNDLRYGLRALRRSPVFAVVATVSLALGIGANTAIFSLLSQVMFRMLPVAEPERLVVFHTDGHREGRSTSDSGEAVFSYPMYKDLRDRNQVFGGVIARSSAPVSVSYRGQTERARAEMVSGNFFGVLGVRPALGRLLVPDDDGAPGAHPVVVLSHGYWKSRFGGKSDIAGQTVNINQHPMVVVGVAPAGFHGVLGGDTPDVLVPIAMKREMTPTWDALDDRMTRWLNIFARLKPGMSQKQAGAAMAVLFRAVSEEEVPQMEHPLTGRDRERFLAQKLELRPAAQGINPLREDWGTPLVALLAMVGLVLLIACANVANLLLARAAGRRKEIAIRLAIGATRWAIVRQLLAESLVVAVAGGAAGLVLSKWTMDGLLGLLPADATGGWLGATLDWRALGFSVLLTLATGLVFGLAPALDSARADAGAALKENAANLASGRSSARFRKGFILAQVAFSVLLLVGAGLFARSFFNLMREDPGFHAENLLRFGIDPRLNGYDATRGWAFYRELQQRLALLPGVRAVACANMGPFGSGSEGSNITVEGYKPGEDEAVGALKDYVSRDYFHTMGIPVIAGREFTERDTTGAPKVVVVNEVFVKKYCKGENAVGEHMAFGGGKTTGLDREIVGVVRDSKHGGLREEVSPFVYQPYDQSGTLDRAAFFVRAVRNENDLGPDVRGLLHSMDANLPVYDMRSMTVQIENSIYRDRLIAILASAFGGLAALLAAIGLYGVVAFNVARRTAEMGVRMALGALPRDVLGLVMREVGVLVTAGLGIGLAAAWLTSRYVESQLFGVKANDPLVFTGAAVSLALVALASGYVPARRASRIDPIKALRYE